MPREHRGADHCRRRSWGLGLAFRCGHRHDVGGGVDPAGRGAVGRCFAPRAAGAGGSGGVKPPRRHLRLAHAPGGHGRPAPPPAGPGAGPAADPATEPVERRVRAIAAGGDRALGRRHPALRQRGPGRGRRRGSGGHPVRAPGPAGHGAGRGPARPAGRALRLRRRRPYLDAGSRHGAGRAAGPGLGPGPGPRAVQRGQHPRRPGARRPGAGRRAGGGGRPGPGRGVPGRRRPGDGQRARGRTTPRCTCWAATSAWPCGTWSRSSPTRPASSPTWTG